MSYYIQKCNPEFFSNGTCSNPEWEYVTPFIPALSSQDAFLIGSAIVSVWVLGFGFKLLRKFIFR